MIWDLPIIRGPTTRPISPHGSRPSTTIHVRSSPPPARPNRQPTGCTRSSRPRPQPRRDTAFRGISGLTVRIKGRDDRGLHLRDAWHYADRSPRRLHRLMAGGVARGRPRDRARRQRRVEGGRVPAGVPIHV